MAARIGVVAIAAMGLLAGACAANEDEASLEVTATEYAFAPDRVDLEPGQLVTFLFENEGELEHELVLTTQAGIDAHLAGGHDHGGDDMGADGDMQGDASGAGDILPVAWARDVLAHEDHDEPEPSPWATEEFPWRAVAQPRETVAMTVHLPDDPAAMPTHIVCLIPGHYEQGMVAEIT